MLTILIAVAVAAVFIAMLLGTAGVHDEAHPPPKPRPHVKADVTANGEAKEIEIIFKNPSK